MQLKDHEKAAIIIIALESEEEGLGSSLLKELPREKIGKIADAMRSFGNVSRELANDVLQEFLDSFDNQSNYINSDHSTTLFVLRNALGPDDQLVKDIESNSSHRLRILEDFEDGALYELIKNENDQMIVLVLAHLSAIRSARIMKLFSSERRVGLVVRIAKLGEVDLETIDIVADFLEAGFRAQKAKVSITNKGSNYVAEVLSSMGSESAANLLEQIETTNPDLADEISKHLFNFEHVCRLDRDALADLARKVDIKSWAVALKGEKQESLSKILEAMSERNAVILSEEIAILGRIRKTEQELVRSKIIAIVREKIESGEYKDPNSEEAWV